MQLGVPYDQVLVCESPTTVRGINYVFPPDYVPLHDYFTV